ncbi:MAG: amidohydrolase family protein, partial [Candidatus Rokuibacteriota bacterium]
MNPTLRETADIEAMWDALARGAVDTIGTDHCPVPRARKVADVWEAAPGLPGMATTLALLITEGHRRRGIPLTRIAAVTALNPARPFRLVPRKGTLRPGAGAD